MKKRNQIEWLYRGLHILFTEKELIDFTDTGFDVVPKTFPNSAPAHSHEGYIRVAIKDGEHPYHDMVILGLEGWKYEEPYYVFYLG